MKSILMSIKPKWCELIATGVKIIEIRKTKPKIDTPFKVYIYKCKSGCEDYGCGKVIGEFVCDGIIADRTYGHDSLFNMSACLNDAEATAYCANDRTYGWNISNLLMYKEPKKLSGFGMQRPPQSWCYVEEV